MGCFFSDVVEPDAPIVIAWCSKCKGEIYAGEEYTTDGERVICPECVEAEFTALPLWAKAQLMGYEARGGEACLR